MKKYLALLGLILITSSCDEDLVEALLTTDCYCEDATSYYSATVLDTCDPGYTFTCYPDGETP